MPIRKSPLSISKPRLPNEAFEELEPDGGKLSCPVLRGLGDRKVVQLLGSVGYEGHCALMSHKPVSG